MWYRNYSLVPADLECVLAYCDNPVSLPNSNGANYNFTWDGALLTNLSHTIFYPCLDNHRLENDTISKYDADAGVSVVCGVEGEYLYPSSWPQCSPSVTCQDPGNSSHVLRTYQSGSGLAYWSVLRYVCEDPRKWIKAAESSSLTAALETRCEWRKTFPLDGSSLVCTIHHCRHPHDEPGNHQPPPPENKISLVERNNWDVGFGENILYRCDSNTFIESEEIDPGQTELAVACLVDVGEYDTPVRQGNSWPNCTETVLCGPPPLPPVNGSRAWLPPSTEPGETYNTTITYSCQAGSQFDRDGDGAGDSLSLTIRCQWNKLWSPHHQELPPCYVTHCVEPFNIPEETNLEEVTSAWTEINKNKEYQCKNSIAGVHTMFWQSDRSRSTFELPCQPDGYFTWKEWPTCLSGWCRVLHISTDSTPPRRRHLHPRPPRDPHALRILRPAGG